VLVKYKEIRLKAYIRPPTQRTSLVENESNNFPITGYNSAEHNIKMGRVRVVMNLLSCSSFSI
jgi:hypothetical protein